MEYQFSNKEYRKILTFMNHISVTADHFREQIQSALSHIWGYNNTVFWISSDDGTVSDPQLLGISDNVLYEYKDHFEDIDLLHPKKLLENLPKQQIFNFYNTYSHTFLYNSDYYNEFLVKHQYIDEMAVNFINNNQLIATLGVLRKKGERTFGVEDIKRFEAISNIILQKLTSHMMKEEREQEQTLFRKKMEHSNDGYILLNDKKQVVYQNESAYNMVEDILMKNDMKSFLEQLLNQAKIHDQSQLIVSASMNYYVVSIVKNSQYNKDEPYYLIHLQQKNVPSSDLQKMNNTPLTNRESEVCGLILNGYTNDEIAEKLIISINTVKRHIQNIFRKLDVKSRSQLFSKYMEKDRKILI